MLKFETFREKLGDWADLLKPFFDRGEMDKIYEFLKFEGRRKKIICPHHSDTYRAFKETPLNELRVVWMLQDPYPKFKKRGEEEIMIADGIAMSCKNTMELQPSLKLFYDGMEDDLYNGLSLKMERNPDLTYLCNQGIMLLNTALTCELDKTSSHTALWKPFTRFLFEEVFSNIDNQLIIVLSGDTSKTFERYLVPFKHQVLHTEHPAAAAHKERHWFHNNVFSKINKVLTDTKRPVTWDFGEIPF